MIKPSPGGCLHPRRAAPTASAAEASPAKPDRAGRVGQAAVMGGQLTVKRMIFQNAGGTIVASRCASDLPIAS
jgi:hypothetical protein